MINRPAILNHLSKFIALLDSTNILMLFKTKFLVLNNIKMLGL